MRFLALAAAFYSCAVGAEIQGTVVSAVTGRPLTRAEVLLRSAAAGIPPLGSTTDENGRFAFPDVAEGQYVMSASRSGYLSSSAAYQNQARMVNPFPFRGNLSAIILRLQPAATISGKVRHEDGEAAPGVLVQAYREVFQRKRHFYEVVGRASTDDRGDYRVFGLPPGHYYVAALYSPYGGSGDVVEQPVRDAHGQLVPPERTVTTFAPSTFKLSEANPVAVSSGETAGTTDIYLARTRVATVTGRVLSEQGGPAEGASLSLLREDASGTGYLPSLLPVRPLQRGEFEIRGVVPGRYVLEGTHTLGRGTTFFARQPVVVGNAPDVTANLLLMGDVAVSGVVLTTSREESIPAGLRIVAEPRGSGSIRTAVFSGGGNFVLRLTAGETYDLVVDSAKGETFAASALLNDVDVLKEGLRIDSRNPVPLLLTVSQGGAAIQGQTQPGASVLLLPRDGILARHSQTSANEWGVFTFSAVAPGDYRLVAWFDTPPCEVWSPAASLDCGRFGTSVSVSGTNSYTVTVEAQ